MTSFSVTSFKKAISEFQEDFAQFSTKKKLDPLLPLVRSTEASGCPYVLRRF
jgi:hypothetical protein